MDTQRAAIYVRTPIEPENPYPNTQSVHIQQKTCLAFCNQFNLPVHAMCVEAATGFSLDDRPVLDELRNTVRNGEVDAVVVEALNRLSRDSEQLITLCREFDQYGVAVYSVIALTEPVTVGPLATEGVLLERERMGHVLQCIQSPKQPISDTLEI